MTYESGGKQYVGILSGVGGWAGIGLAAGLTNPNDGLGAVGIMRAFMSKSHLPPYNADRPFQHDSDRWPPDYASDQLLGQMEWYHGLNTDTARQMAKNRIAFMARFVRQARDEIEGCA